MPPTQTDTSPFEAEVIPLTDTKVDSLIRTNLESFYKAHNIISNRSQYVFDNNEASAWDDTHESTLKFFAAGLLHLEKFQTEDDVLAWLVKRESDDREVTRDTIFKWMKVYMEKQQRKKFKAISPSELSRQLRNLYRLQHDNDGNLLPSPCYLMAKILVKALGSSLLSRGISCADVPGSDDADQNRTEAVSAYLKEDCYARIVVEPAARIEDNSKFLVLLQRHASEVAEIVVVATKIDQLNIDQCRFRLGDSDQAALDSTEKILQDLEQKLLKSQEASRRDPENYDLAKEALQARYNVSGMKQRL